MNFVIDPTEPYANAKTTILFNALNTCGRRVVYTIGINIVLVAAPAPGTATVKKAVMQQMLVGKQFSPERIEPPIGNRYWCPNFSVGVGVETRNTSARWLSAVIQIVGISVDI